MNIAMFSLFQKYTYYFLLTNDCSHFLPLKNWSNAHKDQNEYIIWNPSICWKTTCVFKALRCAIRVAYNECLQWLGNKRRSEYIKRDNILLVRVLPDISTNLRLDSEWKIQNCQAKTILWMVQFWKNFALPEKWIWSGSIKVDVKLTFIKPLQIVWLSDFCNYIKSPDGYEMIRNGCLRSGTADTVKIGSILLPSLDYFQDIINYYLQIRKLV